MRLLRYAEASDVLALIDVLLKPDPAPDPWERMRLDTIDAERATSMVDVVDFGDRMVAFSDSILRVVEGVAPTVLRAASESPECEYLLSAVLDSHGARSSGDASQMVRDVVAELVNVGLISASVIAAQRA